VRNLTNLTLEPVRRLVAGVGRSAGAGRLEPELEPVDRWRLEPKTAKAVS